MNVRISFLLAGLILAGLPTAGRGQGAVGGRVQTGGGRAFNLAAMQQAAIDIDPRSRELQLLMRSFNERLE